MANRAPGILVIDDDEVVLAAISDLLEEAHFRVVCQSSPAGAADMAAADPSIVAVVLDLNMPVMRGDNVARLFLSRARLRDLPLLLVSGDTPENLAAVRMKMPGVKVVSKADMETDLVPALKRAIAERAKKTGARAWGSDPSPELTDQEGVSAETRFFERLAGDMELAREVWREVQAGKLLRLLELGRVLRASQAEANRRALFQAAQLLRGIEQITIALQQGSELKPNVATSVDKAIEALATLGGNRSAGAKFVIDSIVESLRRGAAELRSSTS